MLEINLNFKRSVFISHAEEDSDIALNIAALLKAKLNIEVALDKYFLLAGDNWKHKIENELKNSELLIVLESRIVAATLAPGVKQEIELSKKHRVPIIIGTIRNYQQGLNEKDLQIVDFGKDGKNEDAVFEIAKLMLSKTHPFVSSGLAALSIDKLAASEIHKKINYISTHAEEIYIIGQTFKSWLLEDYGNNIRYSSANIKLYMPSKKDVSLKHLCLIHKNGDGILNEIHNTKKRALELAKENKYKFESYILKVKPMFSMIAVDINKPNGFFSIDHYLIKIPSEDRPKLIIYKNGSPLFELYKTVLFQLTKDAVPLTSINQ